MTGPVNSRHHRFHHLRFYLVPIIVLWLAAAMGAEAQQCPNLVWQDEFDGTSLDTSRWEPQIGDGCDIGLCGWGNSELQYYKAENATVSGGTLKITAKSERVRGSRYTSARLRTLNQGDFTNGRFEARIKLVEGQGLWPAFWMLPTDEVYGGWPQSGEIDIMEMVGFEPNTVHGTIHYGDPYPNNQNQGAGFRLASGIYADQFHTFAIEKEAGEIRWYMDGVLYSVKTPSDVAPYNWPFDERFHFILNLAVGGNWPGDPDASTQFPNSLEVDYVRVYDGFLPSISGDRVVSYQESGVAYSVANASGTIQWTVPSDATIVSGQGTSSITVDFGTSSGPVTATLSGGCAPGDLSVDVEVEAAYERSFTYENFDDAANAVLGSYTGTLSVIPNPDTGGVNPSALSGEYTRNSGEQYDVLVYSSSAIGDASSYVDKTKKFFVDLYTTAAPGTTVLLQLEDSGQATPSNYPTGRHSRFQAETTVQNGWQRLELPFLDQPDPSTAGTSVDTMIFLFAPNSTNGDTYIYDNFDSYSVAGGGGGGGGGTATTLSVASITTGTQGAGKGQKYGTATVTVIDDLGAPVAGASVTGTFSGTFNETVTDVTGADGSVVLQTTSTASGGVSVSLCVDQVTHGTLTYDPGSNGQTCS